MTTDIVERIRNFLASKADAKLFPPATTQDVETAERRISSKLPTLLSRLLVDISNGGFGPGYGLIGVGDGYKSDFGNIADTYVQLQNDWRTCGDQWPTHLLPFCEFGDNIFACISLADHSSIYLSTDSKTHQMSYNIEEFFDKWMAGYKFLNDLPKRKVSNITNPFLK